MRKLQRVLIICCLFSAFCNAAFAQQQEKPGGQSALATISAQAKQAFTLNHTKALSLAAVNGWPVRRQTKTGNLLSLQGVNKLGFPVYLITHNNTTAAATTGTNTVQPGGSLGLNLSGSGAALKNKLAIWDGGTIYKQHQEFAGKTITSEDGASIIDHATHVSGTMIAKGVYAPAKGMAFGATTLHSWDFDNDVSEMSAAASGLLLSNHSYGDVGGWDYNSSASRWEWYGLPGDTVDYNFGFYDERTQSWDKIAYNAPYYLIVESAGNSRISNGPAVGDTYYGFTSRNNPTFVNKGPRPANISSNNGYDIITKTGTAKNILTIGSVSPLPNGPSVRSDIKISSFSSWGPTDDGRIKPDLVADGESVLSTGADGADSYIILSGTSMAAPNVTGSLYLLQEYYAQKNSGNFMKAATLKGLACHTAFDAGNVGPDYVYGWGLLDMKKAAQTITSNGNTSLISENTLQQGQATTFQFTASGDGAVGVTIAWTDPAGTPTEAGTINNRTPKLVNDLDIRISDGATTYTPWVLNPERPGVTATKGDNIRDNIEQILIPNTTPGQHYTVTVSHKGTLASGSQDYSLIATGVGGVIYCTSAPNSSADSKISNFKLANVNYTAPAGCTAYTNNTSLTARLEQANTYNYSITLGTCGNNFNKAAKIFIDYNSNGTFEANELAATTGIINATGTYSGSITIPATVTPGFISLMRIVLVETSDASLITPCGAYGKGETQDYRVEFVKPAVDAAATAIVNNAAENCAGPANITVNIYNPGTAPISNIPVTATISTGGSASSVFTDTYNGTINPGEDVDFTFSGQFNAVAGATYTVTAQTKLPGDNLTTNDKVSGTLAISLAPQIATVTAYYCKETNQYELSATGDGQLLWYKTAADALPFTYGADTLTSQAPAEGKYYVGLNDFSGSIGPKTKNVFTGGGYNQFDPGVKVSTRIPVVIESARLYVGNPGKVTFTVTNDAGDIVSSSTISVATTRSNPQDGAADNDPADVGQVYNLNLLLPAAGSYTINTTYDSKVTLFRNNAGVTGYPFKIGNIFSVDGNTATATNESDTTYYKQYYYYFYDMQVKSAGCPATSRQQVIVVKPTIAQNGDKLSSNIATGNQWLLNGKIIDGATGQTYTPLQSGYYTLQVDMGTGCVAASDSLLYVLTAKNPDKSTDINLTIFPVPAQTYFNVLFVAKSSGSMDMSLVNSSGQTVYRTTQTVSAGNYSTVVNTTNRVPGTYILRIVLGGKVYAKKVIISK